MSGFDVAVRPQPTRVRGTKAAVLFCVEFEFVTIMAGEACFISLCFRHFSSQAVMAGEAP